MYDENLEELEKFFDRAYEIADSQSSSNSSCSSSSTEFNGEFLSREEMEI